MKRQRELAKLDKRRDKAEKKQQRRSEAESPDGAGPPIEAIDPADVGLPELEELTLPPEEEKET